MTHRRVITEATLDRNRMYGVLNAVDLSADILREFRSRVTDAQDTNSGIIGELNFSCIAKSHGIELDLAGSTQGAPDFKIRNTNIYVEVTRPYVPDLGSIHDSILDTRVTSIYEKNSIIQRRLINPLNAKFTGQIPRWNADYTDSYFYLALDVSMFSRVEIFYAQHKGRHDLIGEMLYGLGNYYLNVNRVGGVIERGLEDRIDIRKNNGTVIEHNYFKVHKDCAKLIGVIAIDCCGDLHLYKNPYALSRTVDYIDKYSSIIEQDAPDN